MLTLSSTILPYLSGITSNIQNQISNINTINLLSSSNVWTGASNTFNNGLISSVLQCSTVYGNSLLNLGVTTNNNIVVITNPSSVPTINLNGKIYLNDNYLYIKNDSYHYLKYSVTVDGPNLVGYGGIALGNNSNANIITIKSGPIINLNATTVTQNIVLSDNTMYLRSSTDYNHYLKYSATVDGPNLVGSAGVSLGTISNPNALIITYTTATLNKPLIVTGSISETKSGHCINLFTIILSSSSSYTYIFPSFGLYLVTAVLNNAVACYYYSYTSNNVLKINNLFFDTTVQINPDPATNSCFIIQTDGLYGMKIIIKREVSYV
jgi:hypothetical protein